MGIWLAFFILKIPELVGIEIGKETFPGWSSRYSERIPSKSSVLGSCFPRGKFDFTGEKE